MKRNFRYITKFEEETRSARLKTREMFTASYYKPIVESYFHNVGVIYEESEVTKQDEKNATSNVEVKVYFGGRSEIIPSGMPCISATNQPDGRWELDYESPKGKKLMRELAKKLGDPNRRSSSAQLETREGHPNQTWWNSVKPESNYDKVYADLGRLAESHVGKSSQEGTPDRLIYDAINRFLATHSMASEMAMSEKGAGFFHKIAISMVKKGDSTEKIATAMNKAGVDYYTKKYPNGERSSSARLETRKSKIDWRKYIEIIKIDGNDPAQADESGVPFARGYYFNYIGSDFSGQFGAYQSLAKAQTEAKKDFEESGVKDFEESGEGGIYKNSSSARLETRAKAGELDAVGARELFLFTDNESKLQNQQKSIITNLARKFAKGLYDKDLAIKLWTYLADSASKLYSDGWKTEFTPATRRETARMLEELHFSSVQDEAIDYKKRSTSAQLETRMSNLLAVWLPTNQAYFFFEGDEKKSPSTWTKAFVNQSTKGVLSTKQDLEEWAKSEGKDLTKIRKGLYVVDPDYNTNSSSTQLEKRGWFGGDDEDEEEKQPMSPDDAREEVRLIIMNTHGIYSTWMAMADDATKQWSRTHDDEDEAPTFRDVVDDFTEIVRLGIKEMNKSIDEDSEDSEFPENNFSMPDIKWIFEHSGAQDDLDEKWDWHKE